MRFSWKVKCRGQRLNPNKKKGQSPYTRKTLWIPEEDDVKAGDTWRGWEILEVTKERGIGNVVD